MNATIGTTLKGRYQIIADLKRRAFGKTYRAIRLAPPKQGSRDKIAPLPPLPPGVGGVAGAGAATDRVIQIFQPPSTHPLVQEEAKRRFEQELSILRRLGEHPQIPTIIEGFQENQELYLVREYIPGQSLEPQMKSPWSPNQVIAMLTEVLQILDFVHQCGVIHGNITPANLIRHSENGKIFLTDLARIKEIETIVLTPNGTAKTAAVGTPGYMPLEQLDGKPQPCSDIYALGITAIKALTGVNPRQLTREPKTGQVIWHHLAPVPEAIVAILDRMVCADISSRYPNAAAVLRDLAGLDKINRVLHGHYQIIDVLLTSEQGTTFLAQDQLQADYPLYAIKEIPPSLVIDNADAPAEAAFEQIAQVRQSLGNHSSILPKLVDDFQENGCLYLVQEFIEGEPANLASSQWDEAQARQFLVEALQLLDRLHSSNCYCLALTPDCLKRRPDGKIVLTDLTLIRATSILANGSADSADLWRYHLPPLEREGVLRPNSDIYALGMLMIQGLTGIHPAMLPRPTNSAPNSGVASQLLWRQEARVSDQLAAILDKMVQPYFRDRYQSAQEVLADCLSHPDFLGTIALRETRGPGDFWTIPPSPALGEGMGVRALARGPGDSQSPRHPVTPSPHPPVTPSPRHPVSPFWDQGTRGPGEQGSRGALEQGTQRLRQEGAGELLSSLPLSQSPRHPVTPSPRPEVPPSPRLPVSPSHRLPIIGLSIICMAVAGVAAISQFQKLARNHTADQYIQRANSFLDGRLGDEAIAQCDRAISIASDYAEAWKCHGDALYILERYKAALVSYQKASTLEPKNPKYWNNQGETLYQMGNYTEAIAAHDRAGSLDKRNTAAHKGRGLALIGLNRYSDAVAEFDRAIALDPSDPKSWENKGLALEYSLNPTGAREAYQEALAVYDSKLAAQPKSPTMWVERGRVLSKLQRAVDALASYDKALEISPQFYLAWNAKGSTLYSMGQFEAAVTAYDKALEINPQFYTAWHNRGAVLNAGLGRYEEAILSYEQVLEINPNFYHAWRDKGAALAAMSRYQDAIAAFDKALKIEPNDHKSWVSRGLALTELARDEEALASFDKALSIYPLDAFAWTRRGVALEYLRRDRDALASYEKAVEIQPKFQPAIEARSRLRSRLSR
ncbi:tetratricopeptide repeat protein [[Phormidium] sp. ETS-05]|uniref:tetratricopeptide repeat protein n=1 Tax=[Phormidium] sp. ETS-05 TaxID=222819 RepID=UPI0018EF08E5|nr:tetratricopeptide repeat protein [[Phormidium] sp. ETS-05]